MADKYEMPGFGSKTGTTLYKKGDDFTPPQEEGEDKMISKGGPVSPPRKGMTYEHKYDEDGKLLPGYPKWVPKRSKK